MQGAGHKIILIGDYAVGKSSIVHWFRHSVPPRSTIPTIGASFCSTTAKVRDQTIQYSIWDTAGQERFRSLVRSYYKKAQVCLCVFDVTDRSSFDNIHYWINDYYDNCGDMIGLVAMVANKCDKPVTSWAVSDAEIDSICARYHCDCYRTSCINGQGIDFMFTDVGAHILGFKGIPLLVPEPAVVVEPKLLPPPNSNGCCWVCK